MIKKIIISIVVIMAVVLSSAFYIKELFSPVSSDTRKVDFLVLKGASVSQIGLNLEKAGLIKSKVAFKFYVQLTNSQNKIKAGEFELSPSLSLIQVVDELKKGPKEVWVTIPEGLRREEIALKFKILLDKDDAFVREFMNLTLDKEGYLFPDTYLFPKTSSAATIVNRLVATFNSKVGKVNYKQLIIASLLERETKKDAEKPVVAGILYKRIENNWPLQVDATLQYAKDSAKYKILNTESKFWEPIYSQDKEINSPFNTYKNLGLPPGPISNPGKKSIEAAINPKPSDYWFYIHDRTGQIYFAKTLEEHNLNIKKYLN